jgi:hypothetical protein
MTDWDGNGTYVRTDVKYSFDQPSWRRVWARYEMGACVFVHLSHCVWEYLCMYVPPPPPQARLKVFMQCADAAAQAWPKKKKLS